jgi:hypothetical protein
MSMVMADDENSDRFWLVCDLGHEITELGVKLLCEPCSRNALVVAIIIGEISVLLLKLALQLVPRAFDLKLVHKGLDT